MKPHKIGSVAWNLFRWPLLGSLLVLACGCRGHYTGGAVLAAPAISESLAMATVAHTPIGADDTPFIRPVAVRVTAGGLVIVDVSVVLAVEPDWGFNFGQPIAIDESIATAKNRTKLLGVEPKLFSDGREQGAILIQPVDGVVQKGRRAVLGQSGFEAGTPIVQASERGEVRVINVNRLNKPYRMCVVPLLLAVDQPPRAGDLVDVRINHGYPRSKEAILDESWFRMRVLAEPAN